MHLEVRPHMSTKASTMVLEKMLDLAGIPQENNLVITQDDVVLEETAPGNYVLYFGCILRLSEDQAVELARIVEENK